MLSTPLPLCTRCFCASRPCCFRSRRWCCAGTDCKGVWSRPLSRGDDGREPRWGLAGCGLLVTEVWISAPRCTRVCPQFTSGTTPMHQPFDRAAEDLGNSIHLEHVNVTVPDQRLAALFYVAGLGLTRDPYLMVSDSNMWINVGRSQFHLPSGEAQVLRGHTGLIIAGREALLGRLASVAKKLEGSAFTFSEHNDYVEATCPWGNRVRCYEPDAARFGRITLGIPYF